jgi:hypothetical protein
VSEEPGAAPACRYSGPQGTCDGSGRLRSEIADASHQPCPACATEDYLKVAKERAERRQFRLRGCPCCPEGASGLDIWLVLLEIALKSNRPATEAALPKLGLIRAIGPDQSVVALDYR